MNLGEKMIKQSTLYTNDFQAWIGDQIHMLKVKDFDHLDIKNLIEEMKDLGNSNPGAIESHMVIILMHMLKQKYQPDYNSKSWQDSIVNGRVQIDGLIEQSPSLNSHPEKILDKCYKKARRYASKETKIELSKFEEVCPWKIQEILGE